MMMSAAVGTSSAARGRCSPGTGTAAGTKVASILQQRHSRLVSCQASGSGAASFQSGGSGQTSFRTPSASTSSDSTPTSSSPARHAFLHDFCMAMPYGAITVAAGVLLAVLLGAGSGYQLGGTVAGAGAAVVVLSAMSLKSWKAGNNPTFFTLLSAAVSSSVGYLSWQQVQRGVAVWAAGPLVALSASLTLFLLYNVAAGGNPPPKPKAAAVAA